MRRWFAANGIADTAFLDGTSLPDGPAWKAARWKGRRDIPTPQPPTAQAGVEADLVGFYTGFLTDWVTTSPVEQRWLPALAAGPKRKPDAALVEQLMGWRLRDHGTYLALEGQPPQAGRPSPLHRDRAAFEVFRSLNDAVLPTIRAGHKPSPILPFLVFPLPDADDGSPRAIALLKLIDPDTFEREWLFEVLQDENAPLIKAWEASRDPRVPLNKIAEIIQDLPEGQVLKTGKRLERLRAELAKGMLPSKS